MPSPPGKPYRDPIFNREIDSEYSHDFSKAEKIDLRIANNIISCAGHIMRWARLDHIIRRNNMNDRVLQPRWQVVKSTSGCMNLRTKNFPLLV